ncbi:hypothetical protein [Marinimicrobium sp. ABcell2]|uniref:hypothetical protein n=1 Tax=Marinimicrobium sp. ABcell2 TaxID=3069751 RepID=UPI0027B3BC94|nr:hypothetical protein [Marinimicrobium sp. ABcell2]MDQ2077092.1 hypothetical protein [Marinimicrobium sp. ABcell2]
MEVLSSYLRRVLAPCLVLLWFTWSLEAVGATANYDLEVTTNGNSTELSVTLELQLDADSEHVELRIPYRWGTTTGASLGIKNLTIRDSDCETVLEETSVLGEIDTLHFHLADCGVAGSRTVVVDYRLTQIHADISTAASINQYLPILQNAYVTFIAGMALVIPLQDAELDINVSWKNLPENWAVFASVDGNNSEFNYKGDLHGILTSLFYASELNRVTAHTLQGDNQLVLDKALPGAGEHLAQHIDATLKLMNRSMPSLGERQLIIASRLASASGQSSINGVALNNTVWLQLADDISLEKVALTFTHELLHQLNPGDMGLSSVKFPGLQWFTEGFTEYLTYKVAYHVGLIDRERFIAEINNVLSSLAQSSVADLGAKEYAKVYFNPPPWIGRDAFEKVPYWKGFLLALKWDEELVQSGDLELEHAILQLAKDNVKSKYPLIGPERIEYVMRNLGIEDPKEDIENFIHLNRGVELTQQRYEKRDLVSLESQPRFSLGFTYPMNGPSFVVRDLEVQNNAYQAGLRNGMTVTAATFHYGNHNVATTLKVRELKSPITYLPSAVLEMPALSHEARLPVMDKRSEGGRKTSVSLN